MNRLAVVAVLLLALLQTDVSAAGRPSLEGRFGLAELHSYVGEIFIVYGGAGARWTEPLTLVRIEDRSRPGEPVEQFRLVFEGRAESALTKDSYHLAHPEGGRILLLLEPGVVSDDKQSFYADMVLLKDGASVPDAAVR